MNMGNNFLLKIYLNIELALFISPPARSAKLENRQLPLQTDESNIRKFNNPPKLSTKFRI